jgi:hypothetical protein
MRKAIEIYLQDLGLASPGVIAHWTELMLQKYGELISAGYKEGTAYYFTQVWFKLQNMPAHHAAEICYILGIHRTIAKVASYGAQAIDDIKEAHGDRDIRVTGNIHQIAG